MENLTILSSLWDFLFLLLSSFLYSLANQPTSKSAEEEEEEEEVVVESEEEITVGSKEEAEDVSRGHCQAASNQLAIT